MITNRKIFFQIKNITGYKDNKYRYNTPLERKNIFKIILKKVIETDEKYI